MQKKRLGAQYSALDIRCWSTNVDKIRFGINTRRLNFTQLPINGNSSFSFAVDMALKERCGQASCSFCAHATVKSLRAIWLPQQTKEGR